MARLLRGAGSLAAWALEEEWIRIAWDESATVDHVGIHVKKNLALSGLYSGATRLVRLAGLGREAGNDVAEVGAVEASGDTSKPATRGRVKTGHHERGPRQWLRV
jgi:hypothetical protein